MLYPKLPPVSVYGLHMLLFIQCPAPPFQAVIPDYSLERRPAELFDT